MEDLAEKKLAKLREIAKLDSSYSSILQRYLVLEKQFSDMTTTLSREQEDLVWEFVCTSDELDRRLLDEAIRYAQEHGMMISLETHNEKNLENLLTILKKCV